MGRGLRVRYHKPVTADAPAADEPGRTVAEARWPMAAAVVAALVLTYLLPDDQSLISLIILGLVIARAVNVLS
jgi:hypothetical protein